MSAQQRMIGAYDRLMASRRQRRYYGDSGFYNFGYWGEGATSQREASEALVDRLALAIPENAEQILDVACGMGASTSRLAGRYPAQALTGVNISEAQLGEARKRAPDSTFLRMDATRIEFPDEHFDAVICVEAAFHFDTRDTFLREAWRVLKRGGTLTLSDILARRGAGPLAPLTHVPKANLIHDVAEYRRRMMAAGFTAVTIDDRTDDCLGRFRRNLTRWPRAERAAGRMDFAQMIAASGACWLLSGYLGATTKAYLLVSGRKPG